LLLSKRVEEVCSDIKSLKIQGARKIALAAVKAIVMQAEDSDAKTIGEFKSDLLVAADALAKTRPTEPMLQNSLRFLFAELEKKKPKNVVEARRALLAEEKGLFKKFDENAERISEYGAREIPNDATVLIHCHSNTLMGVVKRAYEMGKTPHVYCTETRPLFQGRISAKELAEAGLDVTLIVDSAVKSVMHKIDLVLVGADSITSTGDLINKIGTAGIAVIAKESGVKFYSCAELYKFDPLTMFGRMTEIEERNPAEIADPNEFKGVKIKNYAFDKTDAKYISGYITEKGIVSPQGLLNLAMKEFGLG